MVNHCNFITVVLFNLFKGIYHYQYKIITKSWFAEELEPTLPDYINDETKSETNFYAGFYYLKQMFLSFSVG